MAISTTPVSNPNAPVATPRPQGPAPALPTPAPSASPLVGGVRRDNALQVADQILASPGTPVTVPTPPPAVSDEMVKLAEKAQGAGTPNAMRAQYDAAMAARVEAELKGVKVTGIEHMPGAGYTVLTDAKGQKYTVYFGSSDKKDLIEQIKYNSQKKDYSGAPKPSSKTILDTGMMTPDEVTALKKALPKELQEHLVTYNPYEKELGDFLKKLPPEQAKIAQKLSPAEQVALKRTLQAAPDGELLAAHPDQFKKYFQKELAAQQGGAAKKVPELPEYLVKKGDTFWASEVKNKTDGSVSHSVRKFEELSELLEKKHPGAKVGGYELLIRPGAKLDEGFSIGPDGTLLKEGKPHLVGPQKATIKVIEKDFAPTKDTVKETANLKPKAEEKPPMPKAEEKPPAPKPEEKPPQPKVEEKPAQPQPKIEEKPKVPGADPELLKKLPDEEVARLNRLAADEKLRGPLGQALKDVKDPAEAKRLLETLEKAPAEHRLGLAKTFAEAGGPQSAAFLAHSGEHSGVLAKLSAGLDDEGRKVLAKMLPHLEGPGGSALLRYSEALGAKELNVILKEAGPMLAEAPHLAKNAGKFFEAMEKMLSKTGLKLTAAVAKRVLTTCMKALPAAGAVVSFIDAGRMALHAADPKLPKEIRYFAGLSATLNGVNGALSAVEALGITDVALPVGLALTAAQLAVDLTVDHLIDQHKEGKFQPSKQMDAFIAGTAMLTGPTGPGMSLMLGLFGPVETARKFLALGEEGSKFLIDSGMFVAETGAQVAGNQLKLTAKGIDALADVIRNPEKYGAAAVELGQKALETMNDLAAKGGELGLKALESLNQAMQSLQEKAQKGIKEGLEMLQWAAANPGELAKAARKGLVDLAASGKQLAKDAYVALGKLGEDGLKAIEDLSNKLAEKGAEAVEMLDWIARNPGEAGGKAVAAAGRAMGKLVEKGGELGQQAIDTMIGWANDSQKLGGEAVDALANVLQKARDVDVQRVLNAWKDNLTDGGQAVLNSLGNLGDAGLDALGKLSEGGGKLVEGARKKMQDIAKSLDPGRIKEWMLRGTREGVAALVNGLGADGSAAILVLTGGKAEEIRKLIDQFSAGHLPHILRSLSKESLGCVIATMEGRQLKEMMQNLLGTSEAKIFGEIMDKIGISHARRFFEEGGTDFVRKLADQLGIDRLASLIGDAGTSVDWIRTNISALFDRDHLQQTADLLAKLSGDTLKKFSDAIGLDQLRGLVDQIRGAGIQLVTDPIGSLQQVAKGVENTLQEAGGFVERQIDEFLKLF